ncbi:TOBE domain-containing protein, partial [Mesorhizobium sp. M2D.F.Ca.ET.145.01.1.1]
LLPGKVEAENGAPVLVADGFRMAPPASIIPALTPGASITVGIRPSDIRVDELGGYEALIEVEEYLGTEALLNLRAGNHELVAQVAAAARPAPGRQSVRIGFDTARLHVFDTKSGEAIR